MRNGISIMAFALAFGLLAPGLSFAPFSAATALADSNNGGDDGESDHSGSGHGGDHGDRSDDRGGDSDDDNDADESDDSGIDGGGDDGTPDQGRGDTAFKRMMKRK